MNKKDDCAGLRAAKILGDKRVSSLAKFSWKDRHKPDSTLVVAKKQTRTKL
jgi:hypothetical protein